MYIYIYIYHKVLFSLYAEERHPRADMTCRAASKARQHTLRGSLSTPRGSEKAQENPGHSHSTLTVASSQNLRDTPKARAVIWRLRSDTRKKFLQ